MLRQFRACLADIHFADKQFWAGRVHRHSAGFVPEKSWASPELHILGLSWFSPSLWVGSEHLEGFSILKLFFSPAKLPILVVKGDGYFLSHFQTLCSTPNIPRNGLVRTGSGQSGSQVAVSSYVKACDRLANPRHFLNSGSSTRVAECALVARGRRSSGPQPLESKVQESFSVASTLPDF